MATIHDVARRARVSPSTVSHVLNRTRFVSAPVRARVEDAVRALAYRPNALAASLRRGRSGALGLIVPDSANPYFAEVGRAVEAAAFDAGFSVILCNTDGDREKERAYVNVLVRNQVDGILVVAAGDTGEFLRLLPRGEIPLVTVDREVSRPGLDCVGADHFQGGRLAAEHLLRLGHRRIACITGPSRVSSSAQRVAGYRKALQDAGVAVDEALIVAGDFHPESGWAAARELLSRRRAPTAIFACNDLMAFGVLHAADELRRAVPGELALVGYDDIELARYTIPPLTTVAQPTRELAQEALRLVARRIAAAAIAPERRQVPVALVVRQSCGGGEPRPRWARGGDVPS